jgi:hypothetical protein
MTNKFFAIATVFLVPVFAATAQNTTPNARPRASDLGLKVGILPIGPLDAITDIPGVEVGHTTLIRGDNIRTGVTAVLPHPGNLYREKNRRNTQTTPSNQITFGSRYAVVPLPRHQHQTEVLYTMCRQVHIGVFKLTAQKILTE